MVDDREKCLDRLETFNDSEFLANQLLELAETEGISGEAAYYLKEAVCNLKGLYDLAHHLAHHVRSKP